MTAGRSLFSPFPPAFAAVPQYLVHISVALLPLTEPDKRLSHTSGSSVRPSVRLRPTTRVQVFANPGCRPLNRSQRLVETRPGVYLALALAVEPFEQDAPDAIGIVAQVPHHSYLGLPDHLSLPQHMAGLPCPVRKFAQALPQLLAAGSALHLEVSLPGLSAVMRKPQKGKLFRFLASLQPKSSDHMLKTKNRGPSDPTASVQIT